MRTGRRWVVAVCATGVVLLAACGGTDYQYLESDDERVFAKIPHDWELVSEGIVDFGLRPDDGSQIRLLPGDDTLPWRAEFTADPQGRVRRDAVAGYVDVQPVDARLREQVTVNGLLALASNENVELGEPQPVRLGELEGLRVQFVEAAGDNPLVGDRLVLTDDRSTVVYIVQAGCVRECFDANFDEIDEIIATFTVEP